MGTMVVDAPPKPRSVIFDRLGFTPTRPYQEDIVFSGKRFMLISGGERGGKSLISEKTALLRILNKGSGLYWLVAADYERTRVEFDYLVEDFIKLTGDPAAVDFSKNINPGHIQVGDIRIVTKSASDPLTLAMTAPDGIIICEASQVDLQTFEKCNSRLSEKRGWLILSGTFETSLGWYAQYYNSWLTSEDPDKQSYRIPSYSNHHIYPGGIDDPEIQRMKREFSDDYFIERIEGLPVPPTGLVFKEFRNALHIRPVDYIPGLPVRIGVDWGVEHAYAVTARQSVDGVVQVFDEIYERDRITEEIVEIAQARHWWKDVQAGAIDIAGTYRQGAMPPSAKLWLDKTGLVLKAQKVPIMDGIERLKGFLKPHPITGQPKIVFSPRCKGIIAEFGAGPSPFDGQTRAYRWKYDREGNILGSVPEDQNNDAIKAVIYDLIDDYGYSYVNRNRKTQIKRWGGRKVA